MDLIELNVNETGLKLFEIKSKQIIFISTAIRKPKHRQVRNHSCFHESIQNLLRCPVQFEQTIQINLDRLSKSGTVLDVLRDGTAIISTKVDLSQSGTSSIRHHLVDPSELLCSQLCPPQVHLLQARYSRHQNFSGN